MSLSFAHLKAEAGRLTGKFKDIKTLIIGLDNLWHNNPRSESREFLEEEYLRYGQQPPTQKHTPESKEKAQARQLRGALPTSLLPASLPPRLSKESPSNAAGTGTAPPSTSAPAPGPVAPAPAPNAVPVVCSSAASPCAVPASASAAPVASRLRSDKASAPPPNSSSAPPNPVPGPLVNPAPQPASASTEHLTVGSSDSFSTSSGSPPLKQQQAKRQRLVATSINPGEVHTLPAVEQVCGKRSADEEAGPSGNTGNQYNCHLPNSPFVFINGSEAFTGGQSTTSGFSGHLSCFQKGHLDQLIRDGKFPSSYAELEKHLYYCFDTSVQLLSPLITDRHSQRVHLQSTDVIACLGAETAPWGVPAPVEILGGKKGAIGNPK